MELNKETKAKIDGMSYESLLRKWRFAPTGDEIFQGESGEYYQTRMNEKREQCSDPVAVSKLVGWGR